MNIEKLKNNLKSAVNGIIKTFEAKQEMSFEFFVGDDVTGVACFGDVLYFSLSDIWLDLITEQPKGRIIDWMDYCMEQEENYKPINYNSYIMAQKK